MKIHIHSCVCIFKNLSSWMGVRMARNFVPSIKRDQKTPKLVKNEFQTIGFH